MKKFILVFLAIVVLFTIGKESVNEEIIIPNESIRIRVIANSNSIQDQEIKKRVKNSVQKQLSEILKDANNIEDVRKILNENLPNVSFTVEKELNGEVNNSFDINYGYNFFPQKVFKGVKYEEGYYESVVIKLGESKGDNWWCVLFPPLCLMEENSDNVEDVQYKSFIKEIIDKYF